jgi:hypothetical protein
VRRGTAVPRARSTQVERALRARFQLWIQNHNGSAPRRFNLFTAPGAGGEGDTSLPGQLPKLGSGVLGEHQLGVRPLTPHPEAVKKLSCCFIAVPLGQAVYYRLLFDTRADGEFALLFHISPNGALE